MDKEKILARARNDKSRGKEYEQHESTLSNLLGSACTLLVGSGLFVLRYFKTNTVDIGLVALGATAVAVEFLREGIKLKKHFRTAMGAFMLAVAVMAILVYIGKVIE